MKKFKALRGLKDLLPEDVEKLNYVKSIIRELFRIYGYKEVMTPTLEAYTLLEAKAGEELRHRMYVFTDLGKRKVALRPEMTPSIARFYINHLLQKPKPIRLGYIANCFRYDEPQYGRYREFWQGGFELIGSSNPEADVEILSIASALMKRLGFTNYFLKVNHIGILREILTSENVPEKIQNVIFGLFDKMLYDEAVKLLKSINVSENCINTIIELTNLKGGVSDTSIKNAEEIISSKYSQALKALSNLKSIIELIRLSEINIPITLDFGFARGLEYYTGIIFECFTQKFKLALGGGGRYDNLIEIFNGPSTPAVGYAPGISRIVLAIEEEKITIPKKVEKRIIVIPVSRNVVYYTVKIASKLRDLNIPVEVEVLGRGVKKALSYASSFKFDYAIIVGETEIRESKVTLKDLNQGKQYLFELNDAINFISEEIVKGEKFNERRT
ncbi:MAG: histidine--tRNA ligase [Candidatus Methanomethylicia archaeon]|nr:histidine--tRNA ligase [Candidatus Methanomethylicia archaeon]MDW7988905.1 histidine--tRNA ligase [Nitrososphaerota archaeon]